MDHSELIEGLLGHAEDDAQQRFLDAHRTQFDEGVAQCLKERADRLLREDVGRSLEAAELLVTVGDQIDKPFFRALGLLAEANARCIGGLGEYHRAIELYNEAAEIYRQAGRTLEQARSQIGKLYALAFLGRYDEAFEVGEWASDVLETHKEWGLLASLVANLGMIHGRMGADERALAYFDRSYALFEDLADDGKQYLPWVDQNRSIVLRNLGHFEASIQASQRVWQALTDLGQKAEAARAQQNLAVTYYVLGQHNKALKLLDQVRDLFWSDGRQRDAILVDLFVTDCLLQLRRFGEVLERCRQVCDTFRELGTRFEVGQALLNQAVAYAGLRRYGEAKESLSEAQALFEEEGNCVWEACVELEKAAVLQQEERFEEALQVGLSCAQLFQDHNLPVKEAQSRLIAARAAIVLQRYPQAQRQVREALAFAKSYDIPSLAYQCHHLRGSLALSRGDPQVALRRYDQAIRELERLRSQLMVEHRVDFVQDKQLVYQDAVHLCLEMDNPSQAMHYAERSKSRALLDLLAYRIDLRVQAREVADQPLVQKLMEKRVERDRLYRRWEGREESREEDWEAADQGRQQAREQVLALEKQITDLWHRLLVRNADYARDASLWRVRTEPIQTLLDTETVLLKYTLVHGKIVAFVVTRDKIEAVELTGEFSEVEQLIRRVRLNIKTASRSGPDQVTRLIPNVQGLMKALYSVLIAPLKASLGRCGRLIIVPHGSLHYLPFHALYDGDAYLVERYPISYLPGASYLHYCEQIRPAAAGTLVVGHSRGGLIPNTLQEARTVAELLAGQASLEEEATLARMRERAGNCRVIHLAAHGEFRPDNPLFSGLALEDGWLTTLDIFDLDLKASLVTLSACQTGQSVVGGGDELLGLMRAFAYAGAASLLLSQWTVEDASTARLMESFYQKLVEGWDKDAALRHAQLELIEAGGPAGSDAKHQSHPYFWAPFFLVGQAGPL